MADQHWQDKSSQTPDAAPGWKAPIPHHPEYPPVTTVLPKSPALAVLASFFIPGLGSMISGNAGIGVLILVLYLASWVLTIILIGFVGVFGFWIWGMIQGYHDAVEWNRRHGIVS